MRATPAGLDQRGRGACFHERTRRESKRVGKPPLRVRDIGPESAIEPPYDRTARLAPPPHGSDAQSRRTPAPRQATTQAIRSYQVLVPSARTLRRGASADSTKTYRLRQPADA